MQFKLNQRIKFLNEAGFGLIKEIRANAVLAEKDDGFEELFPLNEILAIELGLEKEIVIDEKVLRLKEVKNAIKIKKKVVEKIREVDLHFGHLVDFGNDFTPHEKFKKQIFEAEKAIKEAQKDNVGKLILIHGKGSGKLEKAIYDLLKSIPNITFYDADFSKYKLGAVEIIFRK